MTKLQLAIEALKVAAATASAAASARRIYNDIREQAQRTNEFTPEEVAELDAEADRVFSSPSQELSGR